MKSSILITGTSGYIASHFAKYFGEEGFHVVGYDEKPCPAHIRPFLKDVCVGKIGDRETLLPFLKKHSVELVVHCAAYCLVAESVAKPDMYFENNVVQSGNMLNTMLEAGVSKLVFSSTAAVFGNPVSLPISESHPKSPVNPYGETKLKSEQQFLKVAADKKLTLGIFRYFNAAGADLQGQLGEDHEPETHMIPNALRTAFGLQEKFQVFGTDFETRDGTCERDYIHVKDLASAHILLSKRMLEGGHGGEFNLGVGQGYTVKEVLDVVDAHLNTNLPRVLSDRRPGDPSILVADSQKAQRELGWKPAHSDLKTIVSSAHAWFAKKYAQK